MNKKFSISFKKVNKNNYFRKLNICRKLTLRKEHKKINLCAEWVLSNKKGRLTYKVICL